MNLDYKDLGLRCGLEIHQQLDTRKLFCDCPSELTDEGPDFVISRRLRSSAGETGEVDVAASFEARKEKQFLYEGHFNHCCLVETDEEPPHNINPVALDIVLQVCKMLNAKVVDSIQVMRKTVVDGSNTSGFQRTALVGRDGHIIVNNKKIRIATVCIEEDAARIIKKEKNYTVYRLDRLGIPLIEIATEADITSPEEAKDVAAYIGMVLRSTGKVKRGLGTIRQDVNVSIKKGARVEIKGAQNLRQLSKLVEYEVLRQKNLLSLKSKLVMPKTAIDIKDVSKVFADTDCAILKNKAVLGIRVEKYDGILRKQVQPGKRLGTELSEYAKSQGVKGLFHSDEELEQYGISKSEVEKTKKLLEIGKKDAFIIIAEKKSKAEKALKEVVERIGLIHKLVPKEVRKANEDGSSSFLRPMPGSSRMYPETDIEPVVPETKGIVVPRLISEHKDELKEKFGLSDDLAGLVAKNNVPLEALKKEYPNVDPVFLAEYFVNFEKEIRKRFNAIVNPKQFAPEILSRLNRGEIPQDAVLELLVELAKGKKINWESFRLDDSELEKRLQELVGKYPDLNISALMGEAMKLFRGKVSGKKIMEILKKLKGV